MKKISKAFQEEFKGIDVALRRAALKVKEEAEKLGAPYVVAETKSNHELLQLHSKSKQQHAAHSNQIRPSGLKKQRASNG